MANPLYADLSGLPPLLIQTGSYDVYVYDSRRFEERARAAGVDIALEVEPEMPHVFQFLADTAPIADEAVSGAGHWLRKRLELNYS